jgi:predicted nucleotidyltransferase
MKKHLSDLKKRATPTLRKYNVQRAFVFGSFSRGDFTTKSDIDFLMDFSSDTSLFDVIGLKHELEDIFGRTVDIVSRRAVSKHVLPYITKDLQQVL